MWVKLVVAIATLRAVGTRFVTQSNGMPTASRFVFVDDKQLMSVRLDAVQGATFLKPTFDSIHHM